MDAVATSRGGFVTLPGWRDDIGYIPIQAKFSVPTLGITDRQASVLTDGLVRGRINASEATVDATHVVTWTLTLPVIGILSDSDEPLTETFDTTSDFEITSDPLKLDPTRNWKDACGMPTADYIRQKMCFGLPLLDVNNRLYTDAAITANIKAAASRLERSLDTPICPKLYNSVPGFVPDPPPPGVTLPPIVNEQGYDYDPSNFRKGYSLFRVRHRPVAAIHKLSLYVGPDKVIDVPPTWVQMNPDMGDLQILPDQVQVLLAQIGSVAFPLLRSSHGGQAVPHLWRVAYEAGARVDDTLFEVVAWGATLVMLITISDSVTAGLASLSTSIDGVSESVTTTNSSTNSTYGAFIITIGKEIKDWMKENADTYRGIRIVAG